AAVAARARGRPPARRRQTHPRRYQRQPHRQPPVAPRPAPPVLRPARQPVLGRHPQPSDPRRLLRPPFPQEADAPSAQEGPTRGGVPDHAAAIPSHTRRDRGGGREVSETLAWLASLAQKESPMKTTKPILALAVALIFGGLSWGQGGPKEGASDRA